jgi:hypothetical protein
VPDFAYRDWLRSEPQPGEGWGGPSLECVSLLVPLHASKHQNVADLYESVRAQSHSNWQLCFAVDGTLEADTRALLARLRAADERVVVIDASADPGISTATNAALRASRGSLVGMLDHDDLLAPRVLELAARSFAEDSQLDLVYTDEDMLSTRGERRSPLFKPGPSPILLLGTNYVMHLVVLRRELVEKLGGLRPAFDGAQDHDLLLRGFEQARKVAHLPWVGYHWRAGETSVASGSAAKPWAYERGRDAVGEACVRRRLPVERVMHSAIPGLFELVLAPLQAPLPVHVLLHGSRPDSEHWKKALADPPSELKVRSVTVDRWPERVPDGESILLVDTRILPNWRAVLRLLRWAAAPGVGAVGSTGRGRWIPAQAGFGVAISGRSHPLRAVTIHARLPHEVAAAGTGLLLLAAPNPARVKLLAGRRFTRIDALCMGLSTWLDDRSSLFVPLSQLRPAMDEGIDRAALDLGSSPLWAQLAGGLPADFWQQGSDRYAARHPLLTPLGVPPPVRVSD